ncbi:MAG: recombination mediator RecR [Alphaproteobacteria bacterium]|nr:recombination mediator RecR [Alphaproteobacteria bacterium]
MQPPSDIDALIKQFSKLPGIGPRSARRMVLQMIRQPERYLMPLIEVLQRTAESVVTCTTCGNVDTVNPCHICSDERRDPALLCVVEELADLWAMERSNTYRGRYHVLGGTLSAIEGRGPEQLNIPQLAARAADENVKEVILATNITVEGQTTAHYVTEQLSDCHVSISRLAQGIPIGGELDYLDDGTLGAALRARLPFN